MFEHASITIVIPAFNEALNIARVLRELPEWVDHIVVVDDASTDATSSEIAAVVDPRIVAIVHPFNRGVGAAITTGYLRAIELSHGERDAIVVMAGDGQMSPEDLPRVVSPVVRGKADYVKGNRFASPDIGRMPKARRLGGAVFSWLTSLAIREAVSDTQCGFTALRRGALGGGELTALWPSYGYPNDILGVLAAKRLRIAEVPVKTIYSGERSDLKLKHLPPILFLVVRAGVRVRRARGRAA